MERKSKLLITRLMGFVMIIFGLCGGYFIGEGSLLGVIPLVSGFIVLLSKWKLESTWGL